MTSRIRMSHQYGETPPNVFSDFDWIRLHEKELLEKYGECSIIVYKEQVLGVGATYDEAVQDAEHNLPSDSGEITPVHQWLYQRQPLQRIHVRLKTDAKDS
ncbi:MAG: hypothetical protein K8L97_18085 [Anaerolineae bacterium]|nr:hypothetical protein [Anaerolineae bacterium]